MEWILNKANKADVAWKSWKAGDLGQENILQEICKHLLKSELDVSKGTSLALLLFWQCFSFLINHGFP